MSLSKINKHWGQTSTWKTGKSTWEGVGAQTSVPEISSGKGGGGGGGGGGNVQFAFSFGGKCPLVHFFMLRGGKCPGGKRPETGICNEDGKSSDRRDFKNII